MMVATRGRQEAHHVSLAVLFRWKVSNPLLIAGAAVIGLIAFPLLQPAWVMVR
jgi:chromate transporter